MNSNNNSFFDVTKLSHQAALFLLAFGGSIILASILTALVLFGSDTETSDPYNFLTLTISQVFIFFLPAYLVSKLIAKKEKIDYLSSKKFPNIATIGMILVLFVVSVPFLSQIISLNEKMVLPESWASIEQWMRAQEDQNNSLTEKLLNTQSVIGLIENIFAIALIPAICEEFLFRGFLFQWFTRLCKSKIAALFITAIIFSAVHFQFFGFFPRLLLGLYLGLLLIWTRSIWSGVIAHFFNNLASVLGAFLYYNGYFTATHYSKWGSFDNSILAFVLSALLTSGTIWIIWKINKKGKVPDEEGLEETK